MYLIAFIIVVCLILVSEISYRIGREQGRQDFIKEAFKEALAKGYRPTENKVINMRISFEQDLSRDPEDDIAQADDKHALTHADLVQMETGHKNKEEKA